jgi:hypothetical protein
MKTKPKHAAKHRPPPPRWHRNADGLDDVELPEQLMMPAPMTAMIPYDSAYAAEQMRPASMRPAPLPRASITKRAASAMRAKATALKPEVVSNPLDKKHLLGVAAGAGGGIAASLAARELGDNIGEKNLAIGLTALGAVGTLFLTDHWQRIAAGVLAGGMSQYSSAYLTERAQQKLGKETKLREEAQRAALAAFAALPAPQPPAAGKPATPPPRNAYGYPANDNDVYGAVDRAHRAVDAMLAEDDQRNAYPSPYEYASPYGDGAIEVDPMGGYAV